jgi:hypothetical protein
MGAAYDARLLAKQARLREIAPSLAVGGAQRAPAWALFLRSRVRCDDRAVLDRRILGAPA